VVRDQDFLATTWRLDHQHIVRAGLHQVGDLSYFGSIFGHCPETDQLEQEVFTFLERLGVSPVNPDNKTTELLALFRVFDPGDGEQGIVAMESQTEHPCGLIARSEIDLFDRLEMFWSIGQELELELTANPVRSADGPDSEFDIGDRGCRLGATGLAEFPWRTASTARIGGSDTGRRIGWRFSRPIPVCVYCRCRW
jgi:hypothetical protein